MGKEIVKKEEGYVITEEDVKKYFGDYYTPALFEIIKQENLPLMGITILGGKPYINVTGLDRKIQNLCNEKGYEFSIRVEALKDPDPANGDYLVGRKAILTLFDKQGFTQALKKLKEITPETLNALKEAFTLTYTGEGWATPDTCSAIAYEYVGQKGHKQRGKVLVENVIMMAERRATNRAKREATGTGLTSIDELPMDDKPPEEKYPRIKEILNSPILTEKEREILKKGMKVGKPEQAMLDWIVNIHPELLQDEKEPEVIVVDEPVDEVIDERTPTERQAEFFETLLQTHTLTETEKEALKQAFRLEPSEVINNTQEMIKKRHDVEKILGKGKLAPDLLKRLEDIEKEKLKELANRLKVIKDSKIRDTIENFLKEV